jgi:hypothetical protein
MARGCVLSFAGLPLEGAWTGAGLVVGCEGWGGGTWLSSGTSTPVLTAAGAARLGSGQRSAADAGAAAEPMAQGNNTVATLKQAASVDQPSSDLLGLEKFYQYSGVNNGSGASLLNNADAGNVVWNYNAFSNPSRGFQTFVRLSYNSMDTSESSMGFGWSLQASSLMRLGTPLDFQPNIANATTVKLTDGDGTGHLFTWNATTQQWQSPARRAGLPAADSRLHPQRQGSRFEGVADDGP